MSKLLFVSDIHLDLRKDFVFEKRRFEELFSFIERTEADYLILGGDIFNFSNPNLEELSLFYDNINKVAKNKKVIVISGNHEDIDKNTCVFDKIPQVNFTYYDISYEPVIIDKVAFYFVSHHKIKDIKNLKLLNKLNVLISHIRCNIGVVKQEYNMTTIKNKFDISFMGDIHINYSPHPNIHYCGSPYNIKYDLEVDSGVFLIEVNKGQLQYEFISTSFLPQRIKLYGNIEDIHKIINTLDKKNKYKIFVSCKKDEFDKITIDNDDIILVLDQIIENNSINKEDIVKGNFIDILDSIYKVMLNRKSISLDIIKKEKWLIDEIRSKLDNF